MLPKLDKPTRPLGSSSTSTIFSSLTSTPKAPFTAGLFLLRTTSDLQA